MQKYTDLIEQIVPTEDEEKTIRAMSLRFLRAKASCDDNLVPGAVIEYMANIYALVDVVYENAIAYKMRYDSTAKQWLKDGDMKVMPLKQCKRVEVDGPTKDAYMSASANEQKSTASIRTGEWLNSMSRVVNSKPATRAKYGERWW